jgi:hypothetical protein
MVLTRCSRELGALEHSQVETMVRQQFDQAKSHADQLSQTPANELDAHAQTILSTVSAYNVQQASQSDHHQQQLATKLDDQHNQYLANHDISQQALTSVQQTQGDVLGRQESMGRVVTQTYRQVSRASRKLDRLSTAVAEENKSVAADLSRLSVMFEQYLIMKDGSTQFKKSGRKISFLGEHPDNVAYYLSSLQDDLNDGIDDLLSNHAQDISIRHAEWLRSEFKHLVRSAYQEQAAQDPMSTATPFDNWSYPVDTVGFIRDTPRECTATVVSGPTDTVGEASNDTVATSPKRPRRRNKAWWIATAGGNLAISLPRAQGITKDSPGVDEVGFSFTLMHRCSILHVRARFREELSYASRPRLYAQLNVFTQVRYDDWEDIYDALFEEGTLAEIDSALRAGTISPFHIDECNYNLCLYVSIPRRYSMNPSRLPT